MAPDDPGLADLIARHAAHGDAHYPAESNHHLTGPEMAAKGVRLFAGWLSGDVVAMGGYVPWADGQAEVKSMHVAPSARGHGAGAAMLDVLMEAARAEGMVAIWLETGSRDASAPARRLYERAGFDYCAPFGGYVEDPESVFMTRAL
ncbi:GNAT family N-acetyltransferase [Hasllibacter sp. MH4015]|uniref:GNAT family N-acetyltransferase n=1 Tax=Hasllibacter sp. MH4015 TaxID=2854029 RepID=UPI001CD5034C